MFTDVRKIIADMFPYPYLDMGRGGTEINGLPKYALPHGRVVLSFTPDSARDRTFYLMESPEGVFVLLHICKAMRGSKYSRFAVIHQIASTPESIAQAKDTAVRWACQI